MKKESATKRTRNFATVVYPDSDNTPKDWQEILSQQFIPAIISPLHDSDTNPTGEPKKPHYHVLLCYDNVKTRDQAKEIFGLIGGVGCEIVQSIRGYARYLCHLDNPEKAQYNTEDVKCLCGADFNGLTQLVIDKYKAIREIMFFCNENNILAYSELLEYASLERFDWFRVLCDNGTVVIKEYLKSLLWIKTNSAFKSKILEDSAESCIEKKS